MSRDGQHVGLVLEKSRRDFVVSHRQDTPPSFQLSIEAAGNAGVLEQYEDDGYGVYLMDGPPAADSEASEARYIIARALTVRWLEEDLQSGLTVSPHRSGAVSTASGGPL